MSRLSYYADFFVMPALILAVSAAGLAGDGGVVLFVGGALAGGLSWTLTEYVIHRHLFHRLPFFLRAHDEHHRRPRARTGLSSWHSLAVLVVLAAMLWFLLGPSGLGFLAGFASGYLAYIVVHHAIHHRTIGPGHPLYAAKMRHLVHHKGVEANFGVVTPVWDHVFGTLGARR